MENVIENKIELKKGFKPDNQAKKLLSNFENCAYVYPDGIMIREKKTIKQGKYQHTLDVYHVYPCEIRIARTNYRDADNRPITRIVCHNANVLLDGVKEFTYYANNASTIMEQKGLYCNSLTLVTLNGAKHRTDDWPDLLGSEFTVQFDNEYTIQKVVEIEKRYGSVIEYHS